METAMWEGFSFMILGDFAAPAKIWELRLCISYQPIWSCVVGGCSDCEDKKEGYNNGGDESNPTGAWSHTCQGEETTSNRALLYYWETKITSIDLLTWSSDIEEKTLLATSFLKSFKINLE